MKLTGKVAIVTGAGSGMGRAIARKFASEGARVTVADLNFEGAQRTVDDIKKYGGSSIAVKADVSNKADVQAMVATTLEHFSAIHILMNNAGIGGRVPFFEMAEEDWDRMLAANLKSVFLCTQAVLGHMMEQRYGKIINTSSVQGLGTAGTEEGVHYAVAKAGVIQLTRDTARLAGPYGVNVNSIAPGLIITEILDRMSEERRQEVIEGRTKLTLLNRAGEPDDIANLALFLASDDSKYITGQIIRCDGGRTDRLSG